MNVSAQTPDFYYKELSNTSIVSPSETRAICTFLNPALLRVMHHAILRPYMCTMGEPWPDDFAGVTTSNRLPLPSALSSKVVAILLIYVEIERDPSTQRDLIAELAFRDAWDTEFAYKWWNRTWGEARNKIMCEQLKEETARRREWDAESAPVFKHWVNSRKY